MKQHRINEQIRVRAVRLIDADGSQLGVVSTGEARSLAETKGLDLVELSPDADPPVCRLLDWGKYQYEQTKLREKQKSKGKTADVKGIRLGLKTSPHDQGIKAKRATEFLGKGHKVKVSLILRGRENARPELGVEVLTRFIDSLKEVSAPEGPRGRAGREISQLITPTKGPGGSGERAVGSENKD